uniref:Uncharacterized protein n=1 Tax=Rhipicephalus microplus TaxID=6941 RepID=A0A6G5A0P5_RHIMP
MWHVCASLADSTHFAWWQTTHHSRTSYHKLEGLSPGWVKERQRCMCGVFFFPHLSFFSGSAKTPKPGNPIIYRTSLLPLLFFLILQSHSLLLIVQLALS